MKTTDPETEAERLEDLHRQLDRIVHHPLWDVLAALQVGKPKRVRVKDTRPHAVIAAEMMLDSAQKIIRNAGDLLGKAASDLLTDE